MTKSRIRAALVCGAALAAPAAALAAAPAVGQEVEANVALVSDYRFRGVSLSDETAAIQGGFDLGFDSGFYVGTWASSIEPVGNSEMELDLYAGFGGETEAFSYDVGLLLYDYPGASDAEYVEFYGSVGHTFGTLEGTFGVAYAPEQDNIGGDDNLYVYTEGSLPLGESGFSLSGTLGYETGAFGDPDGDGDDKLDWSLGISTTVAGLEVSLSYVDTSEDGDGNDATGVLSLSKAF